MSTFIEEYNMVKEAYPDSIVFMQLGDFYEAFGEDARIVSELLDIILVSKKINKDENIDMAGIPCNNLDLVEKYFTILFEKGYKIALAERVYINNN